jgi:hypothetical protein
MFTDTEPEHQLPQSGRLLVMVNPFMPVFTIVIVVSSVSVFPRPSVTVTEYVPGARPEMPVVVAPVLQRMLYGGIPPETFACMDPLLKPQDGGSMALMKTLTLKTGPARTTDRRSSPVRRSGIFMILSV